MKSTTLVIIAITFLASSAFADGVSFATSEDLAAFDKAVRRTKRSSVKRKSKERLSMESQISGLIQKEESKAKNSKSKASSASGNSGNGNSGNNSSTSNNSGNGKGKIKIKSNQGKKKKK